MVKGERFLPSDPFSMAQPPSAFLVSRRDDGFGDVYPLHHGARYTLGRAPTNRVVLRDDLCSREHAEVFSAEGNWHVRDLGSLNGTFVNRRRIESSVLEDDDEVQIGKYRMTFLRR